MNIKKIMNLLLLSVLAIFISTNLALADGDCKNVQIKINNQSSDNISITAIEYKNTSGAWQTQWSNNKPLAADTLWQHTADLADVGLENTQLRISYQSDKKTQQRTSAAFVCKNNSTQTINLN